MKIPKTIIVIPISNFEQRQVAVIVDAQWSTSPTLLVTEPSGFWTVGNAVSYQLDGGRFSIAYVRNTSTPQELIFLHFFG